MPVYVYRCENCGIQFDKFQKFSEEPLTICPECSVKALHKVYTPVGIIFKGSGFYATDHKSPSGGTHPGKAEKAAGDGNGSASSEASTPAASSESAAPAKSEAPKPAEKAEK